MKITPSVTHVGLTIECLYSEWESLHSDLYNEFHTTFRLEEKGDKCRLAHFEAKENDMVIAIYKIEKRHVGWVVSRFTMYPSVSYCFSDIYSIDGQ